MTRVAAPSRPMTTSDRKQGRFYDRPVRNGVLAAASLVVAAAIALFVLASAQPATVSFRQASYSISGDRVVVYGKVTDAPNRSVPGASVVIYRAFGGGWKRVLAHVTTSPQGLYRVTFHHLPQTGLYVSIIKWLHGRLYRGTLRFRVRPGRSYDVTAVLLHRSTIFFLPVFSY